MLPDKTEKVWLFIDVLYRHMGCGPYHAHILVDIHYTPLKTKHTTTTCTAVAKNLIGLNDFKKKNIIVWNMHTLHRERLSQDLTSQP